MEEWRKTEKDHPVYVDFRRLVGSPYGLMIILLSCGYFLWFSWGTKVIQELDEGDPLHENIQKLDFQKIKGIIKNENDSQNQSSNMLPLIRILKTRQLKKKKFMSLMEIIEIEKAQLKNHIIEERTETDLNSIISLFVVRQNDTAVRRNPTISRRAHIVKVLKQNNVAIGYNITVNDSKWLKMGRFQYVRRNDQIKFLNSMSLMDLVESLLDKTYNIKYIKEINRFLIKSGVFTFSSFEVKKDIMKNITSYNQYINDIFVPDELGSSVQDNINKPMHCKVCKSWTCCYKQNQCTWSWGISRCNNLRMGLIESEESVLNVVTDFLLDCNSSKIILYQPSGGFNNQRIQLENALITSVLLKRTLIIPHFGPHTNYFSWYNVHSGSTLLPISQVFDFVWFKNQTMISFCQLPNSLSYVDLMTHLKASEFQSQVFTVNKLILHSQHRFNENMMKMQYGGVAERFLVFERQSMFMKNFAWYGLFKGFTIRKRIKRNLVYHDKFKNFALSIYGELDKLNTLNNDISYVSTHIRRGDHVSFSKGKTFDQYLSKLVDYFPFTKVVYVATDETSHKFFNSPLIHEHGLRIIRFNDLLQLFDNKLNITEFIESFPEKLWPDIIGILEQLICTYSFRFLGSSYSTFTYYILRLRAYFEDLSQLHSAPNPLLSKVLEQRNMYQSTCNPLQADKHSKPC